MGRPAKTGLDWAPLPTDWLHQKQMRKLMRSCGASAPAVIIEINNTIYYNEGYFVAWDDDTQFDVADALDVKESYVAEVLQRALAIGLYDLELFSGHAVLTSEEIQQNYLAAVVKRKNCFIDKKYSLIQPDVLPENKSDGNPSKSSGNSSNRNETSREVHRVEKSIEDKSVVEDSTVEQSTGEKETALDADTRTAADWIAERYAMWVDKAAYPLNSARETRILAMLRKYGRTATLAAFDRAVHINGRDPVDYASGMLHNQLKEGTLPMDQEAL
jgi:hypothetical protein